jgi:hypothetical protein
MGGEGVIGEKEGVVLGCDGVFGDKDEGDEYWGKRMGWKWAESRFFKENMGD